MADKKDDAPDPQAEAGDDEGKLTLTQKELDDRIAAAVEDGVKKAREKAKQKAKAKAKRQEAEAEDGDDDEAEEDPAEIVRDAETRAAKAEQERDLAMKEALMARVENKLNAYLALNLREFMGNAPDIMLHIEKALSPGAKDAEIARLIESHSKAFSERVKAARRPASGATPGGLARSPRTSGLTGRSDDEPAPRQQPGRATTPDPFYASRWHG